MTGKKTIAFDIDDVLADSTESLRVLVNQRLGINLERHHYQVPGRYWGYYENVWHANGIADKISFQELEPMMRVDQSHVVPVIQAHESLQVLANKHHLIVVTARNPSWEEATYLWLAMHYPSLFSEVHFAGNKHSGRHLTKGEMCASLGVDWLVDDNPVHCQTAIDNGVGSVLFGSFGWHQEIPAGTILCKDWQAVLKYFDSISV